MRAWYVPHGWVPNFIDWQPGQRTFDEAVCISYEPSVVVLFNIDKATPNSYITQFGHIFSNLPGDILLVYDDADVPENIEELLPDILERDHNQRLAYFDDS